MSAGYENLYNTPDVSISSFTKSSPCICVHCVPWGPPGDCGAQGDPVWPSLDKTYIKSHSTMRVTFKGERLVCHIGNGFGRGKGPFLFLVSYEGKRMVSVIAHTLCLSWASAAGFEFELDTYSTHGIGSLLSSHCVCFLLWETR